MASLGLLLARGGGAAAAAAGRQCTCCVGGGPLLTALPAAAAPRSLLTGIRGPWIRWWRGRAAGVPWRRGGGGAGLWAAAPSVREEEVTRGVCGARLALFAAVFAHVTSAGKAPVGKSDLALGTLIDGVCSLLCASKLLSS